jgi:scyllo-inositol 2-dehydrogenase (NADP+)
MKVVVAGLGIQGKKRTSVAGAEVAATVDPIQQGADFRKLEDVPLDRYQAVLACVPDSEKIPLLRYALSNGKHVLVEKPLLAENVDDLVELQRCARSKGLSCYTAYNHRFEPHIVHLRGLIASGRLGRIYSAKFFYGNGTARDARNSPWRDQGAGVLPDLGSHLLDMVLFLFGEVAGECKAWRADRFENRAFDRFMFGFHGDLPIDCEMSMLSYRNTFLADVYGEMGSAHINCLCKWGPSTLTIRKRVLPSGRPDEESTTLVSADPTWAAEYDYFRSLCPSGTNNLSNDRWIQAKLDEILASIS